MNVSADSLTLTTNAHLRELGNPLLPTPLIFPSRSFSLVILLLLLLLVRSAFSFILFSSSSSFSFYFSSCSFCMPHYSIHCLTDIIGGTEGRGGRCASPQPHAAVCRSLTLSSTRQQSAATERVHLCESERHRCLYMCVCFLWYTKEP
eukprot:GHVU01004758.1.p1 GENE.GHVU01004758.1~~GHVU01004758.1.p1  ORF type:complete len:148 (+),score=4.98 GHVU01004758.1:1176-1619(+)